jgi:hypothetical protein
MTKKRKSKQGHQQQGKPNKMFAFVLLLTAAFCIRVSVAHILPNDAPDDGTVYDQMARNLVERHVYSHDTEPPYAPSLIRVPGYPLFLAGVYSVTNNDKTAVRIVQALMDTATCALIALLAFYWEPDEKRKRSSSLAALVLAALCPFTTIYVATIMSETLTMFLAMAMTLTATLALTATSQRKVLLLWVATGLIAGIAVLVRPDSGLFALALGLTLVVSTLARASEVKLKTKNEELLFRTARASYLGAVFSLAFCLALVPWTIRNYRVFHFFQPIASAHAAMPGEFVPHGYLSWVSTWIDDSRYIGPAIWSLDSLPIKLTSFPDRAFDSAEEKQRVGALLERYNHHEEPSVFVEPNSQAGPTPTDEADADQADESATPKDQPSPKDQSSPDQAEDGSQADAGDEGDDEGDEGDKGDEGDGEGEEESGAPAGQAQEVEMTPEIDAGFAKLAQERIARHPLRYYVWLPLNRAHSLWFDTHSEYYPFQGELLPFAELDHRTHQQIWLPLFAGLTLLYTLFGIAGGWFLWGSRNFVSRQWLLLAALMIFLRLGFFSTIENPEPRYTVEFFPFLAILGGIAFTRIGRRVKKSS